MTPWTYSAAVEITEWKGWKAKEKEKNSAKFKKGIYKEIMANEFYMRLNKTHIHWQIHKIMVLVGWGCGGSDMACIFERKSGKPTKFHLQDSEWA